MKYVRRHPKKKNFENEQLNGATAFTITVPPAFTLTINGTGITNNSGATQNFVSAVDAGGKLRKDII